MPLSASSYSSGPTNPSGSGGGGGPTPVDGVHRINDWGFQTGGSGSGALELPDFAPPEVSVGGLGADRLPGASWDVTFTMGILNAQEWDAAIWGAVEDGFSVAGSAVPVVGDAIGKGGKAAKFLAAKGDDLLAAGKLLKCNITKGGCFAAGTPVWAILPDHAKTEAFDHNPQHQRDLPAQSHSTATLSPTETLVPIEQLPLGSRITTRNPDRSDIDLSLEEPDQATWSKLTLRLTTDSGSEIEAELLRPTALINQLDLSVGRSMFFTVDELDLSSWGVVEAIDDCPEIADGEGEVVISRFKTLQAEEMTRVTLADGSEILGTSVHPVWSINAEDWVPLADLVPSERLQTRSGEIEIDEVATFAYRQSVYNFEVHTEHVYEIGELGVLVHNAPSAKYIPDAFRKGFDRIFSKIGALCRAKGLCIGRRGQSDHCCSKDGSFEIKPSK